MRMVSPNDMLQAAKEHMLGGREPEGHDDWMQILNFVAFNISAGLEQPILQLFGRMYGIPKSAMRYADEIAAYQCERKAKKN